MKLRKKNLYLCIISVLATFCLALLVYTFKIPNPMMLLIIAVVFFSYSGGYASGILSGAVALAYSLFFFSGSELFSYTTLNAQKVAIIAASISVVIVLIGKLKVQEKSYIAKLDALNEQLKSFAFIDPLTGTFNRHALKSHFGDLETEKAAGLSFAILDLDFFKSFNDKYGHLVGDKMLQHVVEQIWRAAPSNSNLYRFGGEEFLLVLKTSDQLAVQNILENIRKNVEQTPLRTEGVKVGATVSIGYVCAGKEANIQQAIKLADKYLYEAKIAGRNRVAAAPAEKNKMAETDHTRKTLPSSSLS